MMHNSQTTNSEDEKARAENHEGDFDRDEEPCTDHEQSVTAGQYAEHEQGPPINVIPYNAMFHAELRTPKQSITCKSG